MIPKMGPILRLGNLCTFPQTYLFSLMVPPIEKTLSLSWELLVLWSVESVFTRPEREAMARESPKLAQINSPCLMRITQAVEPVNSVALP